MVSSEPRAAAEHIGSGSTGTRPVSAVVATSDTSEADAGEVIVANTATSEVAAFNSTTAETEVNA